MINSIAYYVVDTGTIDLNSFFDTFLLSFVRINKS